MCERVVPASVGLSTLLPSPGSLSLQTADRKLESVIAGAPPALVEIMRTLSDPDTVFARRFVEEAKHALRFLHDDLGFEGPCVGQGPFAVWVNLQGSGHRRQGEIRHA